MVKNPPANAGDVKDVGLIPALERYPREGNGNPLQHSCLENSMDTRSLAGCPWGCKESDMTEATEHKTHHSQNSESERQRKQISKQSKGEMIH